MSANYQIRWLDLALQDLDEIAGYIAKDDEQSAQKVAEQIWLAAGSLAEFPERARAGRVPGTRELVLVDLPFFIAFRVKDNIVQILRIIHTSRKWPTA